MNSLKIGVGILLLFSLVASDTVGQETTVPTAHFERKNSVQLELGGPALFYSLNYERVLLNKPRLKTTGEVGISLIPLDHLYLIVTPAVNQLISFGSHHAEVGAGILFGYTGISYFYIISRIGYRYQRPSARFFFRIRHTPFFVESEGIYHYLPWGGISLGYTF